MYQVDAQEKSRKFLAAIVEHAEDIAHQFREEIQHECFRTTCKADLHSELDINTVSFLEKCKEHRAKTKGWLEKARKLTVSWLSKNVAG